LSALDVRYQLLESSALLSPRAGSPAIPVRQNRSP
jgi:hypothetical protein